MHLDHMQISVERVFHVHIACQFTQRHPMTHRSIDNAHERLESRYDRATFDTASSDRVGSIQYEDRFTCLTRAAQNKEKRAQVCIKTYANILHIKDKCIHTGEHFSGGFVDRAI